MAIAFKPMPNMKIHWCWPVVGGPCRSGCADGTCGTCQVDVLEGADMLSPADEYEEKTKKENNIPAERRLGCQTAVLGAGVKVRIINVFGEEPIEA